MALLDETFTLDQLREHIRTKLGGDIWRLEGMENDNNNAIDQAISDALMEYSVRCPLVAFEVISSTSAVFRGTLNDDEDEDEEEGYGGDEPNDIRYTAGNISPLRSSSYSVKRPGYGVWRVDFLDHLQILNGDLGRNLTGVQLIGAVGSGEVAQLLTQIKSYRRATTNDPHWFWDEDAGQLFIKANFERACVWTYVPRGFDDIRVVHKDMIRRAALGFAQLQLGENRQKFNNSVAGPGGSPIELNADPLIDKGEKAIEAFRQELKDRQPRAVPVWD